MLVELFSWWTAPGEAEAFQSLVDAHKGKNLEARLFNAAAASGVRAKEILKQRLAKNEPPDLFQENAHDLRAFVVQNPERLIPLDKMITDFGLKEVVYPEVLEDLTIQSHVYSMPVNLHRENTLLFNKKVLASNGLAVPTQLSELLEACQLLRERGITPIATAHQGWILRIMFNSIAIAQMGPQNYRNYFSGQLGPENRELRKSIAIFADILEHYTNSDASEDGYNWTNAAQAVMDGDAAMYFHGDWAKGYLVQLGAVADVDFGVVAAPGTQHMFLYGIDVFALPRHAPNVKGARAFLQTIASGPAQAAFNRIKGSSPIRTDAPLEQLDVVGRATMQDLKSAEVRMMVRTQAAWDDAFAQFAKTHDADALYQTYVAHPPSPVH